MVLKQTRNIKFRLTSINHTHCIFKILLHLTHVKYYSGNIFMNFILPFIKGALSGVGQFLATGSPLKTMKNTLYFTSKDFFTFKIFNFLS